MAWAIAPGAFAQAQPSAQTPNVLQEVVITAQKRPEKLQNAPVAASVVTVAALAKANATDISDLNNLVPSVQLNGTINGRVPMAMRGISTNSNEGTVGISSGVAILVDGVPVPSDSYAGNQLEDIAQIEVLKGPQGTLGGRTAAAGVINIVTRGPSNTFTGTVGATATSDKEVRGNVFVAGPITDKIQFSLAGWDAKVVFPIYNAKLDKYTDQTTAGLRAKVRFNLTSNLDVTIGGRVSETKSTGDNFVYTYITPGSTLLFPHSPLTQTLLFQNGVVPGTDNLTYSSPVTGSALTRDQDASVIINYQLGDLALSSNTAFQHEGQGNIQDLFVVSDYFWNTLTGGHAPPFYNFQKQTEDIKQVSQEFKLLSPADRPFSYLVGAFFSDTVVDETINRALPPAAVVVDVKPDTATYALYGRSTLKLGAGFSLITGFRYNYDVIKYTYDQIAYAPQGPQHSSGSNSSSQVVGDVTVQKQLADRSMVYATYARGYSPAAYNTAIALADNNPITPVKAETVDNFEIGSKGTFLDRRLTLNTSVFYTKYTDYQIQTFKPLPGYVNPPLVLENGGADTRGVEVDVNWAATNDLRLNFNAAYIDAKFTDYKNAPCYGNDAAGNPPATCHTEASTGQLVQDVSGKTMPNSPKFKVVIGADQRIPLDSLPFDVTLSGTYSYRTSAQMLADQDSQAVQRAFGILNLSATLNGHKQPYALTLFVNNVFDQRYVVDVEDFWSSPWGGSNTLVAQPARDTKRYFGVKASVNF